MVFPLVCNQYHYIRRGKIWIFLSNARKVALDYNIDIFSKLLNFKDYEIDNFIRKDIERTILISFNSSQYKKVEFDSAKKDNLFDVLKAYSVYDKDVGYCQGTNFIVGILNTNIPSKRYVFWTFVNIMNSNKWRELYISDTPKLLRMIDILVNLIKTRLPLLFDHFIKQDFVKESGAVFSHFFISIFSYNVPVEYAYRVLDIFFVLEEKIILECIIHLLSLKEDKLKLMNLEELFHYIRGNLIRDCINEYGIDNSLPNIQIY